MLSERLRQLLLDVQAGGGAEFSGIGVLVSASLNFLPIVPLRPASTWKGGQSVRESLTAISNSSNEFHDGFHVLSPNLEILLVSQYFSPPVITGVGADPSRRLGGRYMAALFGSSLPSVLAAGVASASYGVAVFEQGREVVAK